MCVQEEAPGEFGDDFERKDLLYLLFYFSAAALFAFALGYSRYFFWFYQSITATVSTVHNIPLLLLRALSSPGTFAHCVSPAGQARDEPIKAEAEAAGAYRLLVVGGVLVYISVLVVVASGGFEHLPAGARFFFSIPFAIASAGLS